MGIHDLQQMVSWMQQARLFQLSLTTPDSLIFLRRHPSDKRTTALSSQRPAAAVIDKTLNIIAPCAGVFLAQHPCHAAPPVAAGRPVQGGDIVGFLRIDALILPVLAIDSGIISEPKVQEGDLVGYGKTLFTVQTSSGLAV